VLDRGLDEAYHGLVRTLKRSEFRAHLSRELASVRRGEQIVILDRDVPVALMVPYREPASALIPRAPTRRLTYRKLGISVGVDPLAALAEERDHR
jgi:antitoxin (DNA-binding transcriptional repressor) of toxin-antitoxin stability system